MNTTNQLPTLRPGDSHMESLIGAALQGHANTREAMRWLVRQLVPATQTAEVTDAQILEVAEPFGAFEYGDAQGDKRINFARAILVLRPERVPMIARSLAEWNEDDGYAVWWAWNGDLRRWAGEPAYIGSPLCDDWPGYHTHWTKHPGKPCGITAQAKKETP